MEIPLKAKYVSTAPAKNVQRKKSGNSGGTGKAGRRRARGWRKHGNMPANVGNVG